MTDPLQLTPGSIFAGDYKVVRPLRTGGMGSLYVVEQLSTSKQRALKLMLPELVAQPANRKRFELEAKIAARIPSDHVVESIASGVDAESGTPWLAMELLEGEDLAAYTQKKRRLPPAEVLEIFDQLCHALGDAHRKGIVHRDLKPENIFLANARRRGVPFMIKVLDFGIARILAEAQTHSSATTTGLGTPMWMAPEQTIPGGPIGPSTDVWPLGLLAFRLLTGYLFWKAPYDPGASVMMLMAEAFMHPLPTASDRAEHYKVRDRVPLGFDAWFARCVCRPMEQRWANAADAFAALEPRPPQHRRGGVPPPACRSRWGGPSPPNPPPGELAPTLPGELSPTLPGELSPTLPGELSPTLPGELSPTLPGELAPTLPGRLSPTLPGDATQPSSESSPEPSPGDAPQTSAAGDGGDDASAGASGGPSERVSTAVGMGPQPTGPGRATWEGVRPSWPPRRCDPRSRRRLRGRRRPEAPTADQAPPGADVGPARDAADAGDRRLRDARRCAAGRGDLRDAAEGARAGGGGRGLGRARARRSPSGTRRRSRTPHPRTIPRRARRRGRLRPATPRRAQACPGEQRGEPGRGAWLAPSAEALQAGGREVLQQRGLLRSRLPEVDLQGQRRAA